MVHRLFLLLLFSLGILSVGIITLRNYDYYALPDEERPFHPRYEDLKPTGIESLGYGIIGSTMIIIGVTTYSSRKRIRAFNQIGKIKYFLEFHIFLCLVGPMLVMYHTTFKFGGIVAVSFWSMTAVVFSGIIGRYLYVQIPKGIHGDELSVKELDEENVRVQHQLIDEYGLDIVDLKKIDALAAPKSEGSTSIISVLTFFIISDLVYRRRLRLIVNHLHGHSVNPSTIRSISKIARKRIVLIRRIHFLEQIRHIFHYWHVIHLPFTIIMFLILAIHVAVAIMFGYTWIF